MDQSAGQNVVLTFHSQHRNKYNNKKRKKQWIMWSINKSLKKINVILKLRKKSRYRKNREEKWTKNKKKEMTIFLYSFYL